MRMSSKRNATTITRDALPPGGSKKMVASKTPPATPPGNAAMIKASKSSVLKPISPLAKRLSVPLTASKPSTVSATKHTTESSYSRRYSAPNKFSEASSSSKLEKRLSTIVKAKSKNDKGLPIAWRKELYGARPGSAQARLDNLRAALEKEVEEQRKAKASTSKQAKCPAEKKSVSDEKTAAVVPAATATPAISTVATIPNIPVKLPAPTEPVEPEKIVDNHEMDVDDVEMDSPNCTPSSPGAVQNDLYSMECDNSLEIKQTEEAKDSAKQPVPPIQEKSVEKSSKDETEASDSQKLKTDYRKGLSAYSSCLFCVIDTSVFIEHYEEFESFLTKKYVGRQPIVVVPYKVLHELDTVKHKKPQLATNITPVVKFLHRMLRVKDARVKGQHPWDDTVELMPVISPDDSIINCALQVQSATEGADMSVVLVSNDCNMLTKALVANLNSCTMEELQNDYKF